MLKVSVCLYIVLVIVNGALVKRDTAAPPNIFADFQKNMDQLRNCVDQSLATAVDHANEKQLQPVLNVVGDTLNRISKAFEDLTASTKSPYHS